MLEIGLQILHSLALGLGTSRISAACSFNPL